MPTAKKSKIMDYLRALHTAEIGAAGIYMDQHLKCSSQGVKKLGALFKEDAEEELHHAEEIAERILFLGGALQYGKHAVPPEGSDGIAEMLQADIDLEKEAIVQLNRGIHLCVEEDDHGTRLFLERILKDEEAHLKDYERMLGHLRKYGDNYIVQNLL